MGYIANLGGLRFLLALAIVIEHVLLLSPVGHCCVNIFFVISGFLLERKRLNKGHVKIADIKKTLIRLTPGYVTMLFVFFFIQYLILKKLWIVSLFAHIAYVQTWFISTFHQPLNSPTWFLSVYVTLIIFHFLTQRLGGGVRAIFVIALITIHYFAGYSFSEDSEISWWYYNFPVAQMVAFFGGCYLANWFNSHGTFKPIKYAGTIQTLALLMVVFNIFLGYCSSISFRFSLNILYAPISILLIWVMVRTDGQRTAINRIFENKYVQMGGGISLQMFIYHFLFVRIFYYVVPELTGWITVPIVVILTLISSYLMEKYYERPIVKYLSDKFLE